MALACLGAAAVLGLTALIALYLDRPIAFLTRDPGPAVHVNDCTWAFDCAAAGGLSNLGYLMWTVTATVCFLGAWLSDPAPHAWRSSPLLWAGALTTLLLADDMFQIHEAGAYGLVPYGQWVVPGLYATLALALALRFRRFLAAREAWLLVASVALFCPPRRFRRARPRPAPAGGRLPLLGIVLWATFFVGAGLATIAQRAAPAP